MSQYVGSPAEVEEGSGAGYGLAGVVALVVGVFALGIPAGMAAVALGRQARARGSSVLGGVVQVLGWIEIVVTALALLVLVSAQQQ